MSELSREQVEARDWAQRFLTEWARPRFGEDATDALAAVLRAAEAAGPHPTVAAMLDEARAEVVRALRNDGSVCDWCADRASDATGAPDLLEEGRRLASQRDDLIASGVDPADLAVPLAPPGAEGAPSTETTPGQGEPGD